MSEPIALDLFELLPEAQARPATLTETELAGKFVADGAIAWQNGRGFVFFKPPGDQRNKLYEVLLAPVRLVPIGYTPGPYFKSGACSLTFGPGGELWALDTCSPNPATGGDARPVLWQTGIMVGAPVPAGGVTSAQLATVKADLEKKITALDGRLDKIAAGAQG